MSKVPMASSVKGENHMRQTRENRRPSKISPTKTSPGEKLKTAAMKGGGVIF